MSKENLILKQRREKLEEIEGVNVKPYPNNIKPPEKIAALIKAYGGADTEALKASKVTFRLIGRIMGLRRFGKAAFLHIQDSSGRIQVYVAKDGIGEEAYGIFKKFDLGDILETSGGLFRTNTGELTLAASSVRLITKSLRPLPEKFHGLKDKEIRYRQRYVDLIINEEVRQTFLTRAKIIQIVREYLAQNGFLEVETPMMQPIVGGATAKPFVTHHNALGVDLYLRIAPELYLKRLLVGGFERVFELNRNFRNEGISLQHNPEFTMLEFYEAYATYEDLIKRTEELFLKIAHEVHGQNKISNQGQTIDLTAPWRRITLKNSLKEVGGIPECDLLDRTKMTARLKELGVDIRGDELQGKLWTKLFDLLVEPKLIQPTFITHYPTDV